MDFLSEGSNRPVKILVFNLGVKKWTFLSEGVSRKVV